MLAKITAPDQVTLPREALAAVGSPDAFAVTVEAGRIVLTPAAAVAEAARRALEEQGITEADVAAAVQWARR